MILGGTTIVISPLISLMKDQVDSLNNIGIKAAYINSSLNINEINYIFKSILNQTESYNLIYVAPERLNDPNFIELLNSIDVPMIAIDEAHCVSQWGHDFRPSYKQISEVINSLNVRPIITAFTATATELVKNDIIKLLELDNPYLLVTGFDRPNLRFVVKSPSNKTEEILKYVLENKGKSGIIYVSTRKNVDMLYDTLKSLEYKVSKYHAGMNEKNRKSSQEEFIYDKTDIMIATNAFGMGIDKSNIRYVIHYNMPASIENYYQEAGRAGRDGEDSECVLLFSGRDVGINMFLIKQTHNDKTNNKNVYTKLRKMTDYCKTDKCLRKYILEYFNEKTSYIKCKNCSNCSNCDEDKNEIEDIDITIESQKILSCIIRMKEKYGMLMLIDVLRGANNVKIKQYNLNLLSTYNIMSNYSKDEVKDMIIYLIENEYIFKTDGEYPTLSLTEKSKNILYNDEKVFLSKNKNTNIYYDKKLFNVLVKLRKKLSEQNNIPPYILMSDVSIIDMCKKCPKDELAMINIIGMGVNKFQKYGHLFLKQITKYFSENDVSYIKNNNISTYDETYSLYKEGKTIEEIAKIRGFTNRTIEEHYINLYSKGYDINILKYINTKYELEIKKVITKYGVEKLKVIKDNLPLEVTYFDIKYYIAKHNKEEINSLI
ncbi:MAG: RecQ family ATP-dependent DNA helicase [Clostridia bacterium]